MMFHRRGVLLSEKDIIASALLLDLCGQRLRLAGHGQQQG
jgi:hypothetical protein